MTNVNILFAASATEEERRRVLTEIHGWSEVAAVGFLKEDARNPAVRRMAWAELDDTGALADVLARCQQFDAVESAGQPAARRLLVPKRSVR